MFSTGFAVFLGTTFLLIKLPRRTLLRILRHDLLIDIAVTVLVFILHWGTFSGVMAATIAGLFMTIFTTLAKRVVGFIEGNTYQPGLIRLAI